MTKRLLFSVLVASLAACGGQAPARADVVLPSGRILDSGPNSSDILFGPLKLGRRQNGKVTLTPDAVTGNASGAAATAQGLTLELSSWFDTMFAPRVATNVALKALVLPVPRVMRDGFAAAGDGGASSYRWNPANCPNPDNGAQVQPTNRTGCWYAELPVAPPVTLWGALPDYDDTTGVVRTDSRAGFNGALAYAASKGATITIPPGRYWSSRDLSMILPDDNRYAAMRPSIKGASASSTRIFFAAGNYAGLTVKGQNIQGPGAEPLVALEGFSLHKTDYLGVGADLYHMSHLTLRDVGSYGWNYGYRGTDIQESAFYNVIGNGNLRGISFSIGSFTKPNGLAFVGSKFATNGYFGMQCFDCAAFSFMKGSVEGNGYTRYIGTYGTNQAFTSLGERGGILMRVTDAVHPELNGAFSISGSYFERNGGLGDIYYANSILPSAGAIIGNTFNRGYVDDFQTYPMVMTAGSPGTVTALKPDRSAGTAHGLSVGDHVELSTSGGALPVAIQPPGGNYAQNDYYVVAVPTTSTFQISKSKGGAAIAWTGNATGGPVFKVRQYGLNPVRLQGTGFHQWITISGNGMGGLPRAGDYAYPPSADRPYIGIVNPGPYWHIAGINSFADAVERTDLGAMGLSFTPDFANTAWGVMVDGTAGTVERAVNTASFTRTGTGSYAVAFRAPLSRGAYHVGITPLGAAIRFFSITGKTTAGFNVQFWNQAGSAADSAFSFSVTGSGDL